MPTASFLRRQADECSRLAGASTDSTIIEQLRSMAAELDAKATALDQTSPSQPKAPAERDREDPAANSDVKQLYASSNGDVWLLMRDRQAGSVFVRHQANMQSGGRVTDTALEDFLKQAGEPPEKQALLNLAGSYFDN